MLVPGDSYRVLGLYSCQKTRESTTSLTLFHQHPPLPDPLIYMHASCISAFTLTICPIHTPMSISLRYTASPPTYMPCITRLTCIFMALGDIYTRTINSLVLGYKQTDTTCNNALFVLQYRGCIGASTPAIKLFNLLQSGKRYENNLFFSSNPGL